MLIVYLFLPKDGDLLRKIGASINSRMFFLGAGFMLLETRAVVQMALLFGSTWIVNSLVFFSVLFLILLANVYVLKRSSRRLWPHYLTLVLFLLVATVVPIDIFLNSSLPLRVGLPCLIALGPIFFGGVIFARSFADTVNPDIAFGFNIAGAVVGGLAEPFSMLLGFSHLMLLAALFYLLSAWVPVFGLRLLEANE